MAESVHLKRSEENEGRYKTRRLGAAPEVVGSVAESQASGGRLRSRFGGPEACFGIITNKI